jgi:aryl-alcohol dehydrogenase-like predicted oxidoreductase
VVDYCTAHGIGFIPFSPLERGVLAQSGSGLVDIAKKLRATPGQVAIAWVLRRAPVMLPIPGTSKVAQVEENVAAAALVLSDADCAALDAIGKKGR